MMGVTPDDLGSAPPFSGLPAQATVPRLNFAESCNCQGAYRPACSSAAAERAPNRSAHKGRTLARCANMDEGSSDQFAGCSDANLTSTEPFCIHLRNVSREHSLDGQRLTDEWRQVRLGGDTDLRAACPYGRGWSFKNAMNVVRSSI